MKAIKSVLANRKMFRGGGLVPSGNPMQNMNQASGILSSSDSLIDAVANDALSTQGGPTLSMNQGGVARFANGGSNTDALQDMDRVRQAMEAFENGRISRADLNAVKDAVLQKHGGVENLYAKLSPEQKEDPAVREVAFQLRPMPQVPDAPVPDAPVPDAPVPPPPSYEGLIPLDVSAAPEFDPSAAAPLNMGLNPNVPPELQPYLAQSGVRPVLERRIQIAQGAEPMAMDQTMVLNQPEPIAPMIGEDGQQIPSSMFDGSVSIDPNQGIVSATPPPELQREETRPSGLVPPSATISEDLMAEKPEPVIQGAVAPEELSTLERILAEDDRIQREPGFTDAGDNPSAFLWGWKQPNWSPGGALIDKFTSPSVIEQRRLAASGLDPVAEAPSEADIAASEQFPTVESLTEVKDTTEEVKDTTKEVTVETPPSSKEAADAQEVEAELNQSELYTALKLQEKLVADRRVALDHGREGTLKRVANEQTSDTFVDDIVNAANANKQEDLNSKMKTYIDEFKGAMPDYEGKSEWEQGMDIVKMGMAIAAGESPNAITNISKGVLATIDNFTSDEKERRAYEQQIKLSAVKYGLASVEKRRSEDIALAAEGRKRPFELIAVKDFIRDGVKVLKGTALVPTNKEIAEGFMTLYPVTFRQTFLSDAQALADLAEDATKNLIKPQLFSKDRDLYLASVKSVESGVRMKGLLMEAAKIAIPEGTEDSQVLGATPLFKSWVDKAWNALGYQSQGDVNEFRSTKPTEYRTLMKTIGTTMVTEILNESNKTISEGDRARVDDLVAAYSDFDGTFASYKTLLIKLKNLEKAIDGGIRSASRTMSAIEGHWGEAQFVGGSSARDTLAGIRTFDPNEGYRVGERSSNAVPYADIIDMDTRTFTPEYQKIFEARRSN